MGGFLPAARLALARRRLWGCSRCHGLPHFPGLPPQPSLHIAGRSNKIILQPHFGQPPVTRPPQSVTSDQLALGPFNAIAMFHPLLERLGLLLLPPSLQGAVMFAHHHRAVRLVFTQTFTLRRCPGCRLGCGGWRAGAVAITGPFGPAPPPPGRPAGQTETKK